MRILLGTIGAVIAAIVGSAHKAAAQAVGLPESGGMGFQEPASPIMEQLVSFHDLLLWLVTGICVLVAGLILWIIIRYNRKANPVPSKTSHNTLIEVLWTAVPVLILVVIAVPSFKLLYAQDQTPPADLVVKAIGSQWYWTYEYPDYDNMSFDAVMLSEKFFTDQSAESQAQRAEAVGYLQNFLNSDKTPEIHRLLDTDTRIVVPVGKVVKVLVTASDVIHSWTIPAFGIKVDAVPGRLNEVWFKANEIGTYYGQCSELCGVRHAYMPIVVEAVSQEDFDRWVERAQAEYAEAPATTRLASISH